MKRGVMCAALAAALWLEGTGGLPANTENARQAESRRERTCRFQWIDRGTWTAREERLTAECVVAKWPVPGGLETFNRIIACESGWWRKAYNPNGPYVGLGQHALSAWPSRLAAYSPGWWTLRPRWFNSRTALTITARMMADVGLSPWSCA